MYGIVYNRIQKSSIAKLIQNHLQITKKSLANQSRNTRESFENYSQIPCESFANLSRNTCTSLLNDTQIILANHSQNNRVVNNQKSFENLSLVIRSF